MSIPTHKLPIFQFHLIIHPFTTTNFLSKKQQSLIVPRFPLYRYTPPTKFDPNLGEYADLLVGLPAMRSEELNTPILSKRC